MKPPLPSLFFVRFGQLEQKQSACAPNLKSGTTCVSFEPLSWRRFNFKLSAFGHNWSTAPYLRSVLLTLGRSSWGLYLNRLSIPNIVPHLWTQRIYQIPPPTSWLKSHPTGGLCRKANRVRIPLWLFKLHGYWYWFDWAPTFLPTTPMFRPCITECPNSVNVGLCFFLSIWRGTCRR